MSKITSEGVKTLIDRYVASYVSNPSVMFSGYRQEMQTVADYEGRQLIEMMQNADDAKSDIIQIQLDTHKHILSVANNGEVFSIDGVESFMYTGLSTKNKTEYIGNKGLGFRSILNWVDKISILTKEISFGFSREYTEKYFNENLSSPLMNEKIEKEIKEGRLDKGEIPIATLAFPEILEEKESQFETRIVLAFKADQLAKIEAQIEAISDELLLFLPHLKTIIVEKDGKIIKNIVKSRDDINQIIINESLWHIYRSDDQQFEDKLKFKYTIAWQEYWNKQGRFFTYFPTDVYTNLPCIIHATFELTNNRKEINESDANKYILSQVADNLGNIVNNYIKDKEKSNWKAYQFLKANNNQNRNILSDFYKKIDNIRETIAVYPTVSNQYHLLQDIVYHGSSFSEWVYEQNFGDKFQYLLKSIPNDINLNVVTRYSFYRFNNCIESINEQLTLDQRVALIGHIVNSKEEYFECVNQSDKKLPLLLNNQQEIVSTRIRVYTKDTEGVSYQFPSFVDDIEFISTNMYDLIRQTFKEDIKSLKLDTESGDARATKRFLDTVVNIGLDDITDIVEHIVSMTNRQLRKTEDMQRTIKEMVNSLFSIFKSNPDRRGNLTTIKNIPLLSRSQERVNSDELYFGSEYGIGKVGAQIFEGIRKNNDYLASNDVWQLDGNEEIIANFFKWINVNVFTKYELINKNLGRREYDPYTEFILSLYNAQWDVHKTYEVKTISKLKDILTNKLFSIEKLIAWIAIDAQLLEQIRDTKDIFYTKFSGVKTDIPKPSHILYIIKTSGITNNVLASLPIENKFKDYKTIKISDRIFKDLEIPEYKIQEILDILQIKKSFNDLRPDEVYQLLADSTDIKGNIQSYYKMFYEYFKNNQEAENYIPSFDGMKYYCRKGGIGKNYELRPIGNVYYSDNKLLPQQILDNYWFINLPKRMGENNVADFFGVKLIREVLVDIKVTIEKKHPENQLSAYLNKLKPYWLAYRLESLNKESDKKEAAKEIKFLSVELVKKASYQELGKRKIQFEDCDFIPTNDESKAIVLQFSESYEIDDLRGKREFCDVIADLVCITFKVGDAKNTYRSIFKDGVVEAQHILKLDEKEDLLKEAKKMLGVSQEELLFWQKVFPSQIKEMDSDEDFRKNIETIMGNISLPKDYAQVDFQNIGNKKGVLFLRWLVENLPSTELESIITTADLKQWHLDRIEDVIRDNLAVFEQLIWEQSNVSDIKTKESYYQNCSNFENGEESVFKCLSLSDSIELYPEYEKAVFHFALNSFGIDLHQKPKSTIEHKTLYRDIIKDYSFGDSLDDMEKILKEEDQHIYSLMFFEGFEEKVIGACQKQEEEISSTMSAQNNPPKDIILDIFESSMSKLSGKESILTEGGNKNGSHTSKAGRKKAQSGKEKEDIVKNSLRSKGYEVNSVSSKTDSKHYDIEYRKKGEIDWRFLEIKKDSGGYFFLSKYQKDKAVKLNNSDRYDIAIVNDKGIHIIKAPFLFEDDSFENNERFKAEPIEYRIHYKLDKI